MEGDWAGQRVHARGNGGDCRRARAAGESLLFDASFESADADRSVLLYGGEIDIRPFRLKQRMAAKERALFEDVYLFHIRYKLDSVRNSSIGRVDLSSFNLKVEFKVQGGAHLHPDLLPFER